MSRTIVVKGLVLGVLVAALAVMIPSGVSQTPKPWPAQPSTASGEWPMYTADLKGSKYSPLDQINASNFNKLEVAWRFKTDNLGPRPENKLEGTPLMVKGVIYGTGGTRRAAFALDAKTGEQKWVYSMDEGRRAQVAPRQLSGRGLAYWTDGRGDERIILVTIGYRMVSLNAKTGQPIPTFGKAGVIDLKEGVIIGKDKQINLEAGEIGLHSTATVVGDIVIVGSSMAEGLGYRFSTNAKGIVRAFDAKTGKLLWRFNGIPLPNEYGNETWENGSWEWTGNNGVWTQITADPELGLVYLPVETPTIDEYGGNRPGNNLFAESLVAVDLKTGQRKWHYQLVHHPIWDHDISAAPLLIDATIDGTPRKLVAQPTKQGWLYVFDRITGKPIWPIEERPVPQSTIRGEKASLTQPFVTKPPAYSRTHVSLDDLIDFSPALRATALENLKKFRWEQTPFVPPVGPETALLGSINIANTLGGVNWAGASFDPETAVFYAQASNASVTAAKFGEEEFGVINPEAQAKNRIPIWESPNFGQRAGAGAAPAAAGPRGAAPGAAAPAAGQRGAAPGAGGGGGRGALTLGLEGLPIVKPPYGLLTAIDVNKGEILFKVPHGDTPDAIRATLERLGIKYTEKTGQTSVQAGQMVTKTLVVVGDTQMTTTPDHPRGALLRAYDKKTGAQVGGVMLPAPQSGAPMTYMVDGRQYIIVAISGGAYSGEYIAFALPQSEIRTTAAQQ